MKKYERIFGADGMSSRRKKVVLQRIDREAIRVSRLFKNYMPIDVIVLFNQSLSLHLFGAAVNRKCIIKKQRLAAKGKSAK